MFIGLDFGTTNSALAVAGQQGPARLVELRHGAELHPTFRSLLYFDPEERDRNARPLAFAGPAAMEAYLDRGADGRLIQSIKSYLANPNFTATNIFGARFTLEGLIGHLVAALVDAAEGENDLAETLKSSPIVAGRPARFVRSSEGRTDDTHDDFALTRLREALLMAEVPEVDFEYEPVAAAFAYEAKLDHDELLLIGDFGGGTSDFCLLRVGPGPRGAKDRGETILGVSGVGLAGDAFDARIVEHVVAPALGAGSSYRSGTKKLPVPAWLYDTMKRWHLLSFINTPKTRRMLEDIAQTADKRPAIEALLTLIEEERGFALFREVEAAKVALSSSDTAALAFALTPVDLAETVARADFERWIAPELLAIETCIDDLIERTGTDPQTVDRVFLTGGSSFIPAVRSIFETRFGHNRISGGNELTSVATGLALAARQRFS